MKNTTVTVEFGTSKIICVIGQARSIGSFEVLGSGIARYEGLKNGRWIKPSGVEEAVSKALYLAEKKAKRRVKEVYIGVPGVFSRVVCEDGYVAVKTGRITQQDVEDMIDDANQFAEDPRYSLVNATPVYFSLDGAEPVIDVIGSAAAEMDGKVSFVFASRHFIDDALQYMDNLGVKVKGFIPEALAESLFLVPPEERDASAVLLNVGYFDTNVTVVYGDAIVYNRTIPAGGMQIANDLSLVMNIDVDTAEQIKKRYSFGLENTGSKYYDYARQKSGRLERFSHAMVAEIIDARMEHLCALIAQAMDQSPLGVARRTRIFLSGGGLAMMKGARDTLQSQLKRQVRLPGVEAPQLSTPNYFTALALLDFVFESNYFDEGYSGETLIKRLSEKMYD
jgi:Actin-like ATPase involved in cell division